MRFSFIGLRAIISMAVAELLMYVITFRMAPEYISPLFKSPAALVVFVLLLVWQCFGFLFILSTNKPSQQISRVAIVTTFCVVPVILFSMLGPAVLTISQALGPGVTP